MARGDVKYRVVRVHKAQAVGQEEVPRLVIEANEEIGRGPGTTAAMREDAQVLAAALRLALPGGTLDWLTADLMKQAASELVVAHRRLEQLDA